MLYTFETRLTVDPELDALLASNSAHWSWGLRKVWSLLYRQGLSKPQAYAELGRLGFTSHQVGSMLMSAEMKHSALAGAQWRDVAWGLGSNRKLWGAKLLRWFELQVEAASRSQGQPAPALSPAG